MTDMDHYRLPVVPVVRIGSRIHLAASFPSPSRPSGRRAGSGSTGSTPPPLMADVRVVIRRHFPVGPQRRVVENVSEDIALRRQPSRKLRRAEAVERALAQQVLPFVEHPIDRRALVAARKEICAYVSGACADTRLSKGGVQVLVLLDTFACPTLLRPSPCKKQTQSSAAPAPKHFVVTRISPCMETTKLASTAVPEKKPESVGIIGEGRPKPMDERFRGWLPW